MPRFTSHGEVCYEPSSEGRLVHPFWGDFKNWWPAEPRPAEKAGGCGCNKDKPAPQTFASLDEWYERAKAAPSDFNEHMDTLRDLASKVDVAVELSAWNKPALLAMAAGKPKSLYSVHAGGKPEWGTLEALTKDKAGFTGIKRGSLEAEPSPHDLLFIDTAHTAARVKAELDRWSPHCRRWIVLHCTKTFGEKGDDGGPGVMVGMRAFLKANPDWFVKSHADNNHGLTVLSRDPADKKKLPSTVKMAWNYAKALATHTATGRKTLPQVEVDKRLAVCLTCEQRADNRCSVCGCFLDSFPDGREGKALWADQDCPLAKWPKPEAE